MTEAGEIGAEGGREAGDDRETGKKVAARRGFFPIVYGDEVEVSQGGGVIFIAKDEIEIERGGGQWMIGLRELEVERGGCVVMVAGRAEVERGFVGLLAAGRAEFKDGARVMMTLPLALAAGAAAGAVVALATWLCRRPHAGAAPAGASDVR